MMKINFDGMHNINPVRRGCLYLASPVSGPPGSEIRNMMECLNENKTHLFMAGGISTRPVLIISDPDEWDKYHNVKVLVSTTKPDVPGMTIQSSQHYKACDGDTRSVKLELNNVRSISAGCLYKYIGTVSEALMELILLLTETFTTMRASTVCALLKEMKAMLSVWPEYAEDIMACYMRAYKMYPHIVATNAPELIPDFKVENHKRFIGAVLTNNKSTRIIDNVERDIIDEVPEEPVVNMVADEPVEEPEEQEEEPAPKIGHRIFRHSLEGRDWTPCAVRGRNIISDIAVLAAVDEDVITMQEGGKLLGCTSYLTDKKLSEAKANEKTYELNRLSYSAFMSWYTNREKTFGDSAFSKDTLEVLFSIMSTDIYENVPDKIDFKSIKNLKEILGVSKYIDISEKIRAAYYALKAYEVYEIIPHISVKPLARMLGLNLNIASWLSKMCKAAKDIADGKIVAQKRTTQTVISVGEKKGDVGNEVAEDKTELYREQVRSIRSFLTHEGLKSMPPKIRAVFLSIPRGFIKEYCMKQPGWTAASFDVEYKTAVEFMRQKQRIDDAKAAAMQ